MTAPRDKGPDRVIVEADGGARGNPGPAGYGALVRDADTGEVLVERSASLGTATNNVAEYSGLLAGLQAAVELGARAVDVRMDSKLVVEQMSGRWQIKHPGLRPLAARAATLIREFDQVTFAWIPRSRNAHADALANAAMDAAASGPATGRGAGGAAPKAGDAATWEPPTGVPTRFILVLHGETELTAQRRYSGRGDVPLSDRGHDQARAVAARIARLDGVAAVVSSPLARCTGTATPIADALHAGPVLTEPDLIECDFGAWEGRTFAEIRQGWPEEMRAWQGSTAVAPPGGESLRTLAERVHRAAHRLARRYAGRGIVLVTHVSPIKVLLRDALAAGDPLLHRLYLDPAGVSIMDTWPSGQVAVRTVNETAHLP